MTENQNSVVVGKLKDFAAQHDLILEKKGECGFGRPCVGFLDKTGNYVDYNPTKYPDFDLVWPGDERLFAPDGVESYHKADCMAVLVRNGDYASALEGLLKWVENLEAQGQVIVEEYTTGAQGLQAMISGVVGYAIRITD